MQKKQPPLPGGKKKKKSGKKERLPPVVAYAALSEKARALILRAEECEVRVEDSKEELQGILAELAQCLEGASSFEYPGRGPVTLMIRNNRYFWRSKPLGLTLDELREKEEKERRKKGK